MSQFKFGASSLYCNYLYSKELLAEANARGLKLHRQVNDSQIDDALIQFVCERAIWGWSKVYDLEGQAVSFETKHLYQVFEANPDMFLEVLRYCTKLDNFNLVA